MRGVLTEALDRGSASDTVSRCPSLIRPSTRQRAARGAALRRESCVGPKGRAIEAGKDFTVIPGNSNPRRHLRPQSIPLFHSPAILRPRVRSGKPSPGSF